MAVNVKTEALKPRDSQANLRNYQETYEKFRWEEVEKDFSWYTSGKVNIAYAAVDRHAQSWRIALHFWVYRKAQRGAPYPECDDWSFHLAEIREMADDPRFKTKVQQKRGEEN